MVAVAVDITLSMQRALDHKMQVLSNNAANAGTVGFQADDVIFSEYLGQQGEHETHSYLNDVATKRDLRVGPLDKTGNPFHLALQAGGYFGIQTPQGVRYTRSGAFIVSPEGILVDTNGDPVMSVDGGEIVIPAESKNIQVALDGTISDENGIIVQLGVFGFENEFDVEKVGDTQLQTAQAAVPLGLDARVQQGALEQSNINPIKNMSDMMMVSKLYSLNQRFIEDQLKLDSKEVDMLATSAPMA